MLFPTLPKLLRTSKCWNGLVSSKLLHQTVSINAANSPLAQLRQKTGLAYSLCREALNKFENDVPKAEAWLNAQALTKGLEKATRLSSRNAREGLIGLAIDCQNKLATVVELNCETDFVAKNQLFKDFMSSLTQQVAIEKFSQETLLKEDKCPSSIHIKCMSEIGMNQFQNQIAPLVTRLGENIRIHHALQIGVDVDDLRLYGQMHSVADKKSTADLDLMTGRFGAIVAISDLDAKASGQARSLRAVGNVLSQHIIGFNPTYIELPDEIKRHLEEAEQAAISKAREQAPPAAEETLDEDSDDEVSTGGSRDDWPSLMDQHLIISSDTSVRDFCKTNRISVEYFKRFECGVTS